MRSQKSKAQLVFEGYIYGKKITYSNGNTNWRCADYIKHKCFASILTNNSRLVRRRLQHLHPPHTARLMNKKLYETENEVPIDLDRDTSLSAAVLLESENKVF